MSNGAAVILAAGEGTRMKSPLPKVLHPVCGRPMIDHVLAAANGAEVDPIYVITGFKADLVREQVGDRATCLHQAQRLGTGHAVLQAEEVLKDFDGDVLVLYGDTPLLRAETLRQLLALRRERGATAAMLTTLLDDPTGYGRVIRSADGAVARIVEQKDASPNEQAVKEINAGVYAFDCRALFAALARVGNDNAQGEYYLPDVIGIFIQDGKRVEALVSPDPTEILGINSAVQLQQVEQIMQARLERW